MRIARTLVTPLLAACLLTACGPDKSTRRSAPAPQPAPPASAAEAPRAETELTLTGPAAFQGPVPVRCVLSDQNGLQLNFRTGDADTPAVVVRVDDYRGSGPYPAHVFVTGRSAAGGLVTSTGEARLEVRQSDPPAGSAVVLLSGKLDGAYQGEAGGGSIAGRFASCGYSKDRSVSAQEAGTTLVPSHEGSGAEAGAVEDPSKAESTPKGVEALSARPRHPAQATGTAGRLRRRAHRTAHRRHR